MQDPGEASHEDGAGVEVEEQRFRRRAPRAGTAADARDEREFAERLATLTPRVWVTPTIVALNVLVFVAMVATGVSPVEPDIDAVIAWGADWGPLTAHGQPWRLLTSMFLHFGLLHIGLNMWVLWDAGRVTERLFGNRPFLALYLLAGLGGAAASLAWHPEVVSAGASGAVFGVYGGLLAFVRTGAAHLPGATLKRLKKSGTGFVIYNVGFGFLVPGIDNAAHLGGLAVGFLVGRLLVRPLEPAPAAVPGGTTRRISSAAVAIGLACVGALAAGGRVGSAHGYEMFETGLQALADEDYTAARDLFTMALEEVPDEPASYFNRSLAHEGLGDLAAAAADVRSYLEAIPDDADGLARLADLEARARDD